MEVKKALTFVREDDRFPIKLTIGTLLVLFSAFIVPVIIVNGYILRIVRNMMEGAQRPLPDWEDWAELLKHGFSYAIANLVYTLPIWVLMCCSIVFLGSSVSVGGDLAETMAGISAIGIASTSCLLALLVIALAFISPAIAIQYVREGDLSACFRVGVVLGIARDNIGNIFLAQLVLFALGAVAGLIAWIPIIGWIAALFLGTYTYFVMGHLYGQIGIKAGGAAKSSAFK